MLQTFRQIRDLATPRDRREALTLLGVVSVTSVVETLAVASLLPFLAALADPAALTRGEILPQLLGALQGADPQAALQMLGTAVLVLLILSSLGSTLTSWLVQRFVWGALHRLASRLLVQYLRQPYTWFLGRNTSDLSRALLSEVDVAMSGVIIPLIFSVVRAVPAVLILALLVVVDPTVAVVTMGVLSAAYGVAYLAIRRRQASAGLERVRANEARFQAAAEALSGIKAVKILGQEDAFARRFDAPSRSYARATGRSEFMGLVPRYILEAVAFGGMVALVLVLLSREEGLPGILPLLGLYAFAGYRLLPSLQQIFLSLNRARFHGAGIQRLHRDLVVEAVAAPERRGVEKGVASGSERDAAVSAVDFRGVAFTYPQAAGAALREVSFSLPSGGCYGFIGPSGSGKTTAMDLVLGLLAPSQGEVQVLGAAPGEGEGWGPARVGYVPQEVFLVDDSLAANVALGLSGAEVDRDRVREVLEAVELEDLLEALPEGMDTPVGERGVRMSGGQRQRVGIARALYPDPEILVMDEGTSALDGATEARVLARLRSRGRTLLLVAHRLQTVQDADRVLLFHEGRLRAQGSFPELLASHPLVQEMAREGGSGLAPPPRETAD